MHTHGRNIWYRVYRGVGENLGEIRGRAAPKGLAPLPLAACAALMNGEISLYYKIVI